MPEWGATLGAAATLGLGDAANRHPPELAPFDARGERIDAVAFHPAWHELMRLATAAGVHCSPWADPRPGAQVARAAHVASACAGRKRHAMPVDDDVRERAGAARCRCRAAGARARLAAARSRARLRSARPAVRGQARGADRHGDDRAAGRLGCPQQSHAATAGVDGAVRLTGHKWFFSAPQCDAHLVLAQEDAGLACFLLPRILADGTTQRRADQSIEGQARQPVERVGRSRIRRRACLADRRGRPWRRHDSRNGPAHPPRLRARRPRA